MALQSFKNIVFLYQQRAAVKLTNHIQWDKSVLVKPWLNVDIVCIMTIMLQKKFCASSCSKTFGKL